VSVVAGVLLGIGTFLLVAASIGFLRLPDFFTRMHAISKADTLGAVLSLAGLACLTDDLLVVLKLLLIGLFVFLANPVATHALSRAAVLTGMRPWVRGQGPGVGARRPGEEGTPRPGPCSTCSSRC
jgi:multicomponent Na+:H+ antiporter subunit G